MNKRCDSPVHTVADLMADISSSIVTIFLFTSGTENVEVKVKIKLVPSFTFRRESLLSVA
jgi:hypothetical protein